MITLKSVLTINGVSSGVTGLGLVFLPEVYANLFEVAATAPFVGVGWFLVIFAAGVLVAIQWNDDNASVVAAITFADTAWVVASVTLLVVQPFPISLLGNIIILAVALWVALMAVLQYRGLRTLRSAQG